MWFKDDNQKKTPGSGFWSHLLAQVNFTAEDDWDLLCIHRGFKESDAE